MNYFGGGGGGEIEGLGGSFPPAPPVDETLLIPDINCCILRGVIINKVD